MTAESTTVTEICPLGGATLAGYKLGWLKATSKAAQNDTIVVTNATLINTALLQITTGVAESNTVATNVITCTSGTGSTTVRGLIIYK